MRRAPTPTAALAASPTLPAPTHSAPGDDPVECLPGPHTPEAFLYCIVWFCAACGAVPEPIDTLTGCEFGFPFHNIECEGGSAGKLRNWIADQVIIIPPRQLGPC